MRYYFEKHQKAYREITSRGCQQWNDLLDPEGGWTYDHFQNRAFLECTLQLLDLPPEKSARVLEYGCGSGPAACFLAGQGYQVDAVDLIPEAITLARRLAEERSVSANFGVGDICALDPGDFAGPHDIVLDSFYLQSIVTDDDRAVLFAAVSTRLKPDGYYIISTAIRSEDRDREEDSWLDASTAILYQDVPNALDIGEIREIAGRLFVPHRRHHSPTSLRNELVINGFDILHMDVSESANVVCRRSLL